jgi:UDP-N-acetylglucosamine diphosphorylase/glucosamine-1-phosphate N-acetyltransferase
MRIVLFEDHLAEQLSPVTLLRPTFEVLCGRESLRKRLQRWFPTAEFGAVVRPWLKDVYSEFQPDIRVNQPDWIAEGPILAINGRWLPERRLTPLDLVAQQAGFVDGTPVWISCDGDQFWELLKGPFETSLQQFANSLRIAPTSGHLICYPWDLVRHNQTQLERDFVDAGVSQHVHAEHVQVLGPAADVYISEAAVIDPYVVIDARTGPVSIDRDVHIQSFTRIEGPCHIGRGTQVFRALIREGTTIGEHCRVGGEIENSILHAFVNKYHEGFLGHSYVCPWVNLGAMTCTSDLKNDYGSVRVPVEGVLTDSGMTKIGSFIGDHSKASLDSMFNTGSTVGVMSMVLAGGRLLPRHIPSFSNVVWGEIEGPCEFDQSVQIARAVMARRDRILTQQDERLLRIVCERTEAERTRAVARAGKRRRETVDRSRDPA